MLAVTSGCSRLDEWWLAVQRPAPVTHTEDGDASLLAEPDAEAAPRAVPRHVRADSPDVVVYGDAGAVSDSSVASDATASGDGAVVAAGPSITALWVWVPIYERMEWNGPRVGYFRAGASLRLRVEASVGTGGGCPRGWYEVEGGGFVCLNRMTTLDPHELDGRRPNAPDMSQAMPYPYMTTYRPAVMYRWLPSQGDLREVEPERFAPAGAPAASAPTVAPTTGTGALLTTGPSTATTASSVDGGVGTRAVAVAPANREQAADAGVRIEDLQGASGSPLLRRVLAGMYISVDREMASAGRRFWRTHNGGYIERGAVSALRSPPTFQGITLDETHALPMAFMVAFQGSTYDLSPDGLRVVRREAAPRLTAYHLASETPVTVGRQAYYRTREGLYLRDRNIRLVRTSAPPSDVGTSEKWVEVNLDRQMLIAYEGARPVYVTLISSGRRNRDEPQRNYETIQGAFRIYSKHVTTTMDGNSAGDGPYSIEDVPWVMYFEGSFALHGAFWHNLYGYQRSHGCVNMAPADARWVFQWSEPQLPEGWHGVQASERGRPGTRVYVHYESQALGERGGPRVVPGH
ncbi:MAG: L,D-transpeptidase [Deltaproteobacteria bacterium]|nr:L,D-transpeptidase [Deltaproteobacteria bacterium]